MNNEKSTFEAELEEKGTLLYTNVGNSMMPLIRQHKDILIIRRPEEWNGLPEDGTHKLKRYDVPLYKRDSGQYVLHRVMKVREKDYVICGDNRWARERGISDRHVIGVLTGMIRNGKELSVTDRKYQIYVHLWCDFYWIRAIILYAKGLPMRIWRKLRRKFKNNA